MPSRLPDSLWLCTGVVIASDPWPQERIRIPEEKMEYYKDLAEMYVGDDVSPDFYGWVFPKCEPA